MTLHATPTHLASTMQELLTCGSKCKDACAGRRTHLLCCSAPVTLTALDAGAVQQGADWVCAALVVRPQVDQVPYLHAVYQDAGILF